MWGVPEAIISNLPLITHMVTECADGKRSNSMTKKKIKFGRGSKICLVGIPKMRGFSRNKIKTALLYILCDHIVQRETTK